jgi:hypothetical protein
VVQVVEYLPSKCEALSSNSSTTTRQKRGASAHAYNPSYSGGRDQEDHGSAPAWANSLQDPILKKAFTKKAWWSGSRCRP